MTKVLMMAALLVGLGSVSTESAFAKGSNLGGADPSRESIGTSSFKKRQKAKEAASRNQDQRSKDKKK